jgi:hypothetical protein
MGRWVLRPEIQGEIAQLRFSHRPPAAPLPFAPAYRRGAR